VVRGRKPGWQAHRNFTGGRAGLRYNARHNSRQGLRRGAGNTRDQGERVCNSGEVGIDDGEVKSGEGEVERSCYCIHAPIHKALPQAKAVFHTHMPHASALTRLEDPRIKEIGQTEVGLSGAIAYDDEYTGPALDPAEGARLAKVIGDKTVLFMANHGITTVGASVAEAYDKLYYVERAAQVQIYAMWTGQRLKQLPAPVVEKTRRDYMDDHLYKSPTPAERHFAALKRMLDRKEPDYAT
jgi:ribulose-5-phosphate 4-epimerase/fuculose-1-phosphate aldolase